MPDPRPDWAASDLPAQGQEDLRRLKELGGGTFDVEAGLAAFEERIGRMQPGQAAAPRSLLLGALVLSGLAAVAGFVSLRTDVISPTPSALATAVQSPTPVPAPSVDSAPVTTTSIPSMSVDALPTVAIAPPPRPVVVMAVASTSPTPAKQADVDLIDAEVRHASTLRTVARTDPRAALSLAAEGDRLFPNGLLHAEREAIAIEALARLDRTSEAKSRADAFVSTFPTHPRAVRVRAIARGERPWEL